MKKGFRTVRRGVATLVLVLTLLAFLNVMPPLPQVGTALMMAVATGAGMGLALVFAFLLVTFLFGRFYCAVFCPLGILQDLIGWFSRRKCASKKNLHVLRYALLAVTGGFFLAGWVFPVKILEPFSMFGRMAVGLLLPAVSRISQGVGLSVRSINVASNLSGMIMGACLFLIMIALVVWKRRVYCTAICPVGTVLGLCAKHGVFQLRLQASDCIGCGQCAAVCPAGCIDLEAGALDNERCVRCMNCVSVCPKACIVWERVLPGRETFLPVPQPAEGTPSRRTFLFEMAGTLFVSAGIAKLLKPGGIVGRTAQPAIYPPGAGSAERFATKCSSCLLCVTHCQGNVLLPPTRAIPFVHLDYERGMCEFNCHECAAICPTGAIRKMALDQKKRCRIGMAVFTPSRCIAVVDGTHCGACAEHCPTGALRMVQHAGAPCPTPELQEALCIGCGNCSYPCPVRPVRAITIAPVSVQVEADDPNDIFNRPAPLPPSSTDDWLL